jgi:uncharacterized protein (TIGR03067 family)
VGCLAVTCLAVTVAAPAPKETLQPLLGHWACTARIYNGRPSDLDPCEWEFATRGKLVKRLGGYEPDQRRYAVDPTTTPGHLDLITEEETVEAIFRVEGDTLTICYCNTSNDRPNRFESPAGTNLILMTFRRAKPKN